MANIERDGFNEEAFIRLFEQNPWSSIEELYALAENAENVLGEQFKETAHQAQGKSRIRQILQKKDPKTGEPLGVSIVGADGDRLYKAPRLFDDRDYKVKRDYHYERATYHCRETRKWESRGGLEQMSLDLRWIDSEAEDAVA